MCAKEADRRLLLRKRADLPTTRKKREGAGYGLGGDVPSSLRLCGGMLLGVLRLADGTGYAGVPPHRKKSRCGRVWSGEMVQEEALEKELFELRAALAQERKLRERAELLLVEERRRSALAQQMLQQTQTALAERLAAIGDVHAQAKHSLISARGSFLMRMSHELRTPLNVIIGYAELLLEEGDALGVAEREEDLEKIYDAGHTLLRMIDDVLELARIESGRLSFQMASVDVSHFLKDVLRECRVEIERKGNTIRALYRKGCEGFSSDLGKLRHILRRSLQEICRWTSQKELRVAAHCEGAEGSAQSWLCLDISGWDLPEAGQSESLDGLLGFFMDGERERACHPSFGLLIVQRLCDLLGGEMKLYGAEARPRLLLRLPSLTETLLQNRGDFRRVDFSGVPQKN